MAPTDSEVPSSVATPTTNAEGTGGDGAGPPPSPDEGFAAMALRRRRRTVILREHGNEALALYKSWSVPVQHLWIRWTGMYAHLGTALLTVPHFKRQLSAAGLLLITTSLRL